MSVNTKSGYQLLLVVVTMCKYLSLVMNKTFIVLSTYSKILSSPIPQWASPTTYMYIFLLMDSNMLNN